MRHEPSSQPMSSNASSWPLMNSRDVMRAALGCWLLKWTIRTLFSQSQTLKRSIRRETKSSQSLALPLDTFIKTFAYVHPSLSATASQGSYGWNRITEGTNGFRLQKSCSSNRLEMALRSINKKCENHSMNSVRLTVYLRHSICASRRTAALRE